MIVATDAASAGLAWARAIREPQLALHWSLEEWERVVRIARRLRLLARLAESLDSSGLLDEVHALPRRHLIAEQRVSRRRTTAMIWALERVRAAIGEPESVCVLLKGAAYLGQELPIAAGRMPADVDILVPRNRISDVQSRLAAAGWVEPELDAHDRRYYHEWSHEVPPLVHPLHPIELDLHHNILPPTARTRMDMEPLLSRAGASNWPGWMVLHPVDQVLHCAAHLFFDSEARDRVRDIVDLDGLFRWFGREDPFWDELPARAAALGLMAPLALACHFCVAWFDTPIPQGIRADIARAGLSRTQRIWLVPLLASLLTPIQPDDGPPWHREVAGWILLARYHRWRMPLSTLVPHALHKLRQQRRSSAAASARNPDE